MLTVGSLFAGIGGFDLGLERAGMQVKWQVEIDPYCLKVLEKHWPHVRRYTDITTVDWSTVEPVDLVCGGFPCQPFSVAGKQRGCEDERNLWPQMRRAIEALRPTWVLGENVANAIRYIKAVCKPELEALGYRVRVYRIPACAVGALHERSRAYLVAYSASQRLSGRAVHDNLWEAPCEGQPQIYVGGWGNLRDLPASRVCRSSDGLPARSHRLRSLGNAVVPQVVEELGRMIIQADREAR